MVGVFPEATISQSFTVKEIKSGAARMAAAAGVPLMPMALWGTQRLWTKGRPRALTQRHVPISILVGEPTAPGPAGRPGRGRGRAARRMSALLDRAQREYPDKPAGPDDRWWLPAHLGGTRHRRLRSRSGRTPPRISYGTVSYGTVGSVDYRRSHVD